MNYRISSECDIIVKNITKKFDFERSKFESGIKKTLTRRLGGSKKRYLVALDNISFSVSRGEIFGIIGLNGSGKTTLLRTIAGIYQPDSGEITIKRKLAPILGIGTGFNNELNARENITISSMLFGMSKEQALSKVDRVIHFAELEEFAEMKLKHYSAGMKARLAFSTAIQINPDILLVDEILSVGDIKFKKKSITEFMNLKSKDKTLIYTSHNMPQMEKICDRILLLHHGKTIEIGDPQDVIQTYRELAKTND